MTSWATNNKQSKPHKRSIGENGAQEVPQRLVSIRCEERIRIGHQERWLVLFCSF